MIPLTKYGAWEMVVATVVFGTLTVVGVLTFAPAAALPAAAWLYVMWFFRDPPRHCRAEDVMVSPADGKVADITPVGADSPLGAEGVRIGIFMNIFSVHVNRSPVAATVEQVTHHEGGFVDARRPDASERNESTSIRLRCRWAGQNHKLLVRQVAGLIARRIVTDLRQGQELATGQRMGMIKFGSRVELWVPAALGGEVAVAVGQKVRAGVSPLVRLPRPGQAGADRQETAT